MLRRPALAGSTLATLLGVLLCMPSTMGPIARPQEPATKAAEPAPLPSVALQALAKADGPVTGKAGELVVIDSKAKGEVAWYVDERLRTPQRHYVDAAKKALVVTAPAGRYFVLAISVEGTRPTYAEWTIVIEGGPDPGPGPGPGPDPTPDTLDTKMRTAVRADLAAGKGTERDRATLQQTFATMPQFMDNAQIKTVGDVRTVLSATLAAVMPKGSLPGVAKVVGDHIAARIPEGAAVTLSAELRARAKAVFTEIATALEKSK